MKRYLGIATFATLAFLAQTPLAAVESILVERGSTWKYLDDGSDQGSAWREVAFDDLSWAEGDAHLGYGDGDEITEVGFGGDPNNVHITTYYRHTFAVSDPLKFVRLDVALVKDDGAVVYLNETEIFRANMPGGTINFDTLAATTESGSEEDIFYYNSVDPGLLVTGANVLAVEIHQRTVTSSDTSFDLEIVGNTSPLSYTRGPYLQLGTPTSVVVRWSTDPDSDSRVVYGLDPMSLSFSADDPTVTDIHEVQLENLTPDTTYFYRIGTTGAFFTEPEAVYSFTTSPDIGESKPTRIWAIGDAGTSDLFANLVRDGYLDFTEGAPADLWLMLGDNAYDDGEQEEYQSAMFEMYPELLATTVVWPTLGNHDGHSADSAAQTGPYYDIYTLPKAAEAGGEPSGTEAYYSFDYGNIHFICLESYETDRSVGSAMMSWLEDDITKTGADWIIAFWHHPPYSKGSHNSDSIAEEQMTEMRQNALPILEDFGVDLVLCGHSHSYERSFLLDGHYSVSVDLEPEMILDDGDGNPQGDGGYHKPTPGPAPHEGAVYVVAGSSGKLSSASLNHPVMYFSGLVLGSVVIDIDGLELSAAFVDPLGDVIDTFSIIKASGNNTIFVDGFESGDTSGWSATVP